MASEKKRNITWKEMKKQKVLIIWLSPAGRLDDGFSEL